MTMRIQWKMPTSSTLLLGQEMLIKRAHAHSIDHVHPEGGGIVSLEVSETIHEDKHASDGECTRQRIVCEGESHNVKEMAEAWYQDRYPFAGGQHGGNGRGMVPWWVSISRRSTSQHGTGWSTDLCSRAGATLFVEQMKGTQMLVQNRCINKCCHDIGWILGSQDLLEVEIACPQPLLDP